MFKAELHGARLEKLNPEEKHLLRMCHLILLPLATAESSIPV